MDIVQLYLHVSSSEGWMKIITEKERKKYEVFKV